MVNAVLEPDGVLAILKEESARHRRNNFVFRIICLSILMFMGWATFAGYVEWSSLLTIVGLGGATLAASGRHKMAATVAAQLQDPRALGYLVEFLASEDKGMRAVAEMAVHEILGKVDESTFRSLDEHQRGQLTKTLNTTKDLDMAATLLGAAKRVGGPEWIRPLEQFAEGHSPMRARDKDRATSLAKMALADIRMRAAQQKIDEKLGEVGAPLDVYAADVLREDQRMTT